MIPFTAQFTDTTSALGRLYARATKHFLHGIDPQIHANAYIGEHDSHFAESEFAGKYLAVCCKYAQQMRAPEAYEHARLVAESIMKNQRADGYIGGLAAGMETHAFSVWNQAFTLYGLLEFYALSGDKAALACGERIALWAADTFMNRGEDICAGGNNGSQHLSLLLPLVRLSKVSDNPIVRDFVHYIVMRIRTSDNNFFDFDSILDLRSKKGIENFVILIGMLEYGDAFGDAAALPACEKYWEELAETQIRDNGNGTLREVWTEGGNAPRLLDLSLKPDENCVAVGWLEFSLALYFHTGEAKYLDEIEKTVYNHLLGALEEDGSDFAYYQPNFGRRVTRTAESMYKCCRYRGYTAAAHLPDMLFRAEEDTLTALLYANARYEDDRFLITEETGWPYEGGVTLHITAKEACTRTLRLRIPAKTSGAALFIDGEAAESAAENGWISVTRQWSGTHEITLAFTPELRIRTAEMDGITRVSAMWGCVLLAAETDGEAAEGAWETLAVDPAKPIERRADETFAFDADGTRICDYASAGRGGREFAVWMKRK